MFGTGDTRLCRRGQHYLEALIPHMFCSKDQRVYSKHDDDDSATFIERLFIFPLARRALSCVPTKLHSHLAFRETVSFTPHTRGV